jgi:hypothetical protein
VPFAALVDGIRPTGRATHARQARVGMAPEAKERLRQGFEFISIKSWAATRGRRA